MNLKFVMTTACLLLASSYASAHHSFAPYDIRNPVEVTGVAESFIYRRPHPKLTLVDSENVKWEIEVPIRFWERAGLAEDAIKPGDEIMVLGHPARNGAPKMAMGGFEKDGTYHSIHERVGQRTANEAADAIEKGESLESVLEQYGDSENPERGERSRPEVEE